MRASVLAMLLADGRFPAGTYAHSLGLEQAVSDGLGVDGVPAFMAARQRLIAAPDAAVAVAALRAGARDADATGALRAIEDEWSARCPSPVLRAAARRLGAALLRSATVVQPAPLIDAYRAQSPATPRPIALGVVGAAWGLDDEQVALLALYDDAATVASAALKLLPLDPADASGWVAQLGPSMQTAARAIAADIRPLADHPAPAGFGLELAAAVHAERRERLFAS